MRNKKSLSKINKSSLQGASLTTSSFKQRTENYLLCHKRAIILSLKNLRLSPFSSLLIFLAIGVSLSLPTGIYLLIKNVNHISSKLENGTSITLYLKKEVTDNEAMSLAQQLQNTKEVSSFKYLTPTAALAEFRKISGLDEAINALDENPLPGVITLLVNERYQKPSKLKNLQHQYSKLKEVSSSQVDHEWVQKLYAFIQFGQTFALFVYLIVGIAVIFLVSNTIRLALEKHKEEIEVLELIGATNAFIRRPFLYRGIWYGLIGTIITFVFINIAMLKITPQAKKLTGLYGELFSLETLSLMDSTLILFMGLGLSWLGALIAFGQQKHALNCDTNL